MIIIYRIIIHGIYTHISDTNLSLKEMASKIISIHTSKIADFIDKIDIFYMKYPISRLVDRSATAVQR